MKPSGMPTTVLLAERTGLFFHVALVLPYTVTFHFEPQQGQRNRRACHLSHTDADRTDGSLDIELA